MIELEQYQDRVILVGLCEGSEEAELASLGELSELAKTAGAEVITQIMQRRSRPDPATYIGSGKIDELRELTESLSANGIICDDELSPAQMKNLQDQLGCKIMDRALLILDIFAGRATTSEGKIQVELAQLKYRQMRLIGMGRSMSRLGGGIGTRGPGEKKLETDRRLISERIGVLNRELKEVRKHRDVIRKGRGSLKTAAIVGYTNAGKSTLLNHLTDADVLEEEHLAAAVGGVFPGQDAQQGGLARSVGGYQGHLVPFVDIEVNAAEQHFGTVALGEIFYLQVTGHGRIQMTPLPTISSSWYQTANWPGEMPRWGLSNRMYRPFSRLRSVALWRGWR